MATTHYGTFPILLPGTVQSMSRNGLQKTSGTILCLPGQEDQASDEAQNFGSVYPDVNTRTTDMGLVEVTFDAYLNAGAPTTLRGTLLVTLSKTFEGTYTTAGGVIAETTWTIIETWLVDTFTTFTTVPATAASSAISASFPSLSQSLKRRTRVGRVGSGGQTSLDITWATTLTDLTRRNFGDIDEVEITYAQTATLA